MTHTPAPPETFEEALNHIAHLLQCAAATAYESGDRLKGVDRNLSFSVMHLIELAKARIDEVLSQLSREPA